MARDGALVVFCRRPALGVGKQRLAATLGAEAACDIGLRLLDCALEDAAAWPGPVALSPADAADAHWAANLLGDRVIVVPQQPGNLGERLQQVDSELRAAGFSHLLFVGSDAPAHDAIFYSTARTALANADVVLAPAQDGGVTLMAARRPWPPMADLPWSTEALGQALADRCRTHSLTVQEMTASFDIDEPADLARCLQQLANDPRPARRALCEYLRRLELR